MPDSEPPAPPKPAGVTELPIEKIAPNPLNQRTEVDEDPEELERMAAPSASTACCSGLWCAP